MIDEKDKQILFELFQDARKSNKTIAKDLRIPERTIANRINKMIEDEVITKFTSIVNYQNLGYNRHSIYFDLKHIEIDVMQKKVEEITKIDKISCCYVLHEVSHWKLYVSIWTKTIGEYDKIQTKVLKILKDYVMDYVSFQSVRSYTYLSRLLNPKKIAKCDVKEETKDVEISEEEKKLIEILHKDSRKPLLEIAQELGVHTDTIKRKIKRLQKEDVLQRFYPLVDFTKMGIREYTFICRLNASHDDKIEKFIKWARANPHFVIVIKAVGWVNLYYAFQTENDQQFKEIRSQINKMIGDIILKEYRIEVEKILQ